MTRTLLIEDNANLAFGLRNNLEIEGYEVDVAVDGAEGLDRVRATPADLVVLDLMLPDLDGFRVLRAIRDTGSHVPIVVLTARGAEGDKVRGLRLGADDYVTKPFSLVELLARIEALLRRAGAGALPGAAGGGASSSTKSSPAGKSERIGVLRVDARTRTVVRGRRPVALTPKEFDLLLALLRRRGAVASRRELLREVWGYPASVATRTLDTHIAELRRKLENDPTTPRHILTVRKAGYRLAR